MNGPVNPEPTSNEEAADEVPGATPAADPMTVATSSGERAIEPGGGAEAGQAHAEHAERLAHGAAPAEGPAPEPQRPRPSEPNS